MKLFLFISLIAFCSALEHKCPPNEIFQTCGTLCESTCENPNASNGPCKEVCIVNVCQCARGFVRNSSGACVNPSECSKPKCAKNEHFYECGTQCEPTCKTPNPVCNMMCNPNVCQCSQGFVRNEETGDCVGLEECPKPTCAKNEQFYECGTHCEPTCENPEPICIQSCLERVCQCSKGFVRHGKDCIQKDQCPK